VLQEATAAAAKEEARLADLRTSIDEKVQSQRDEISSLNALIERAKEREAAAAAAAEQKAAEQAAAAQDAALRHHAQPQQKRAKGCNVGLSRSLRRVEKGRRVSGTAAPGRGLN